METHDLSFNKAIVDYEKLRRVVRNAVGARQERVRSYLNEVRQDLDDVCSKKENARISTVTGERLAREALRLEEAIETMNVVEGMETREIIEWRKSNGTKNKD